MPKIIMTIKAPRGTLNLYAPHEPGWFMRDLKTKWQCEAIKAFMEQHSGNA